VIATDASENQIAQARAHPGIEYRVATAYESGIASGSADAVTVAQAMHWLDANRFYQEAKRVLAGGGVLVIWGYGDPVVEPEPVNRILHEYNRGTIERFWQPERDILLDGYRGIPFPFQELEVPEFTLEARWNLDELSGLLRTWSATAAYAKQIHSDPIAAVEAKLLPHWGKREERHHIRWPLFVRAGISR
jgi:SAM-dependent methyltransferase